MRRAARVDENQKAIAEGLNNLGWRVRITSMLGQGFPDLVCARMGFTALAEVKNPTKPKADQQLTPDQVEFHAAWPGVVLTVYSVEDALKKLNAALVRSGACRLEDLHGLSD